MSETAPQTTILVTGATGNVGRPLVEQLLAAGHRVRALTRDPAKANLPAGAEAVAGDLADTASLAAAFEGVGAAHLIGFDAADFAPLANGAEIVDLAVGAGVRKVTVLRGDVTRGPLEEAVVASGLEWTELAPVEFMSNVLEWAESVRTEGVVRDAFPEARSALVHEADIAAVAATALTTDGHAGAEYWLTGPEALTHPEKVRAIGEALGREVRYVELTRDEIVARWRAEGWSEPDIEFFLAMRTDPPAAGATVLPTVERVTGRPARTFAQWARENAAAFGG
ncbi:NmrA family NAD(P)-binding protein [Streptomyces litchfieldiae]|uniref:NmrA family NAD(P)-binding protein n=1 Tax=Streptomyces litchfieldiae TaxID=3075543 RepID=A0ABU2MPB5_9ACTN|nr:NmrA family NAD(P)-binding protein [Streptomyces sp. DSM 44938]MDT0343390.1 NmrA family NAD(P)-binding protein [Streptomyces sp. DSM 44938]